MKLAKSKSSKPSIRRPEPVCLYSVPNVAVQCDVSEKTVRRLIEKGTLRSVRVGRSVRIPHAALMDHLARM
jgi:excisionase family DNA binding protein